MIHVIPVDDKVEHTSDCSCCNAHLDADGFWIHHSADKREQFERNGKIGKPWQLMWEDAATGQLVPLESAE